jgi:hypothetical protein
MDHVQKGVPYTPWGVGSIRLQLLSTPLTDMVPPEFCAVALKVTGAPKQTEVGLALALTPVNVPALQLVVLNGPTRTVTG